MGLRLPGWCAVLAALALQGCARSEPAVLSVPSKPEPWKIGALTVPYWNGMFTYGGTTYPFSMVGTDPNNSPTTTVVNDEIVPVDLVFSDGVTLKGSNEVGSLVNSPLFLDANYPEGSAQFADALMRSEFSSLVLTTNYHVLLANPVVEPTAVIQVPATDGYTVTSGKNTNGFVTFDWFIQTIEPQLLQQYAIDPTTVTMFVTKHTKVIEPGGYCCYSGYHQAFNIMLPQGLATFTTAWSSVGPADITGIGHEVAEWMNDPFYKNAVPPWVSPSNSTCGHKLEVGDPSVGILYRVNGYLVEDMTFYSWFARMSPSIGINGTYDMLGKFSAPSSPCPT